jgi:hypothetical protein
MRRFRFSIRTALAVIAVLAVFLTVRRVYLAWFERTYSAYHLVDVLRTNVRNGDTIEQVKRHFHQVRPIDEAQMRTFREICQSRGWQIAEGDEIMQFTDTNNHGIMLQFRDGKLINHQPTDFSHPSPFSKLNSYRHPNWFVRNPSFVAAAVCAVTMVLACVFWASSRSFQQRSRPTAHAR